MPSDKDVIIQLEKDLAVLENTHEKDIQTLSDSIKYSQEVTNINLKFINKQLSVIDTSIKTTFECVNDIKKNYVPWKIFKLIIGILIGLGALGGGVTFYLG